MKTELVHEDEVYTITKTERLVKYTGCQCFSDCNCRNNYPFIYVRFVLQNKNYHKNQHTVFLDLDSALNERFRINQSRIKYGKVPFVFSA